MLQLIAIKAPIGDAELLRKTLLVCSYLLLFTFVAFNLRHPGILVLGVGLVLNFAAIIANEGFMAITPETILRTGPLPHDAVVGHWLPDSKDVLLQRGDARLYFLCDRLVWDPVSSVFRAFSIGDLVISAGLALAVLELLVPRFERAPATPPMEGRAGGNT